jgi:hypothetical protein
MNNDGLQDQNFFLNFLKHLDFQVCFKWWHLLMILLRGNEDTNG